MPRYQQHSWSGSERQRRPQGTCSSNGYKPVRRPAYTIPAGTRVKYVKIDANPQNWRPYVTKRTLEFDSYESRGPGHYLQFREQGYLIRVPAGIFRS